MNLTNPTKILPKVVILALSLMFLTAGAINTCSAQQTSEDLLLKIMDLHSQLVGNEVFLAQAKMLGAYLEAAKPLEETKKVKIYKTVLQILTKIRESPASISPTPSKTKEDDKHKTFEAEQEGRSVYVPGTALLEIFKGDPKTQSIPDLPVIRTYWNRNLSYTGGFLVPERALEIGRGERYVARFSFYYEAKKLGRYGFSVVHNDISSCKLTIGGVEIFNSKGRLEIGSSGHDNIAAQGVCKLEKGFHRLEIFIFSKIYERYSADNEGNQLFARYYRDASFQVKVLTPGGFDAVPITKDMMLLRKE
jgi:hypothetical protein